MNKHEKIVNIALVIIATISIGLFALVFVVGDTSESQAQVVSGELVTIFVEEPNVAGTSSTTISGQAQFVFRFAGPGIAQADEIRVLLYDGSGAHDLHCYNEVFDATYRWRMTCDTLAVPNATTYQFGVKVHSGGSEITLVNSDGVRDPRWPIAIMNNYAFLSPSINGDTFSGNFPFNVQLSGAVNHAWVTMSAVGSTATTHNFNLNLVNQNSYGSNWEAEADSTSIPDGDYRAILYATSLGGSELPNLAQRYLSVQNSTVSCSPQWSCSDWSECLNNQQTRTCTDVNYCGDNTSRPPEWQTCSTTPPPANNPPQPTLNIVTPASGDTIGGDVQLRANVEGAVDSVAFFYRVPGTSVEHFIGDAVQSTNVAERWGRTWNTLDVPNRGYYVFARANNSSGTYISNFVNVAVYNETDTSDPGSTDPPPPPDENFDGTVDTDGDQVDDQTEEALGSDIYSTDTDQDSIPDAQEIIANNDPSSTQALDALVDAGQVSEAEITQIKQRLSSGLFEQPTTKGVSAPDKLRITKIENNRLATGDNELIITGTGPANTFVTLFIYSNPIVVTTKTDASGNFTYTLDKNVLDGEHEVYVTVTDDTGKINEKSSPFAFFVRSAQAVSEEEYLRGNVDVENLSDAPVSGYVRNVALVVLTLIGALLIGWLIKRGRPSAE